MANRIDLPSVPSAFTAAAWRVSSSFRAVLRELYGERFWPNYGPIPSREDAQASLIPPGTQCIHGHFLADTFDGLFPGSPVIVWVRHPVERLVSKYYYLLRDPDMSDSCCRTLHERGLSLRAFADLPENRNEQTRYRAAKSFGDFAFVGVAERFADSTARFRELFGIQCSLPVPCDNVNPLRDTATYPLWGSDREYILERNVADLCWYEEAAARLDNPGFAEVSQVA
jgi:hypothetical protein